MLNERTNESIPVVAENVVRIYVQVNYNNFNVYGPIGLQFEESIDTSIIVSLLLYILILYMSQTHQIEKCLYSKQSFIITEICEFAQTDSQTEMIKSNQLLT